LSEIRESIDRRVWLSVYGFRRVGKTSVVNVAVNDQRYIVVKVNLMRLYDPKKRRYSRPDFIRVFLEGINETIRSIHWVVGWLSSSLMCWVWMRKPSLSSTP
jgi:hypothetical protein